MVWVIGLWFLLESTSPFSRHLGVAHLPTFCLSTKPHINIPTSFQQHQLGNHCNFKENIDDLINLGKDSWKQIPWHCSIIESNNHDITHYRHNLWPSYSHGHWLGLLGMLQIETSRSGFSEQATNSRTFPFCDSSEGGLIHSEACQLQSWRRQPSSASKGAKTSYHYHYFHLWNGNFKIIWRAFFFLLRIVCFVPFMIT